MIESPLVIDTASAGVVVVRCQPDTCLDGATVQLVHEDLETLVAPGDPCDLVFDLAQATFVSSPALTMLIHLRRGNTELGRRVVLCGMQPHVRRLFAITRLDRLFAIHADSAAAVTALQADAGGPIGAAEAIEH